MKVGLYHNSMMFNLPSVSQSKSIPNANGDVYFVGKGQAPLTVKELYEVMRRWYMPQVGYMKFSNKSILGKRKISY